MSLAKKPSTSRIFKASSAMRQHSADHNQEGGKDVRVSDDEDVAIPVGSRTIRDGSSSNGGEDQPIKSNYD